MKKIIVTGGCGYIGSHTIIDLLENGFEVVSFDNLSHGIVENLSRIEQVTGRRVENVCVDLSNEAATLEAFAQHQDAQGVIHFAAYKSVPESVEQPLRYYENNIKSTLHLLKAMRLFSISALIFSSSCSVYGNVQKLPVTEDTPYGYAESPYAYTKQVCERMIIDFAQANPHTQSILLRYFNPAGAHPSGQIGEDPNSGTTNLVPIIMEVALGKRKSLKVFGTDYETRDGSCIRDYIHIMDLASAHTKALHYILGTNESVHAEVFNVGIGEGLTVLEIIHAFERVTGKSLEYTLAPRRAGDVAAIYANFEKAAQKLGWNPQYRVDDIMESAWNWALQHQHV